MEIKHQVDGNVIVFIPIGRIDGATAQLFQDHCSAYVIESCNNVIVDFSNVTYISSAGLRALLNVSKKSKSLGGKLVLCKIHGSVKDVIIISGFDVILGNYLDVEGAKSSFK